MTSFLELKEPLPRFLYGLFPMTRAMRKSFRFLSTAERLIFPSPVDGIWCIETMKVNFMIGSMGGWIGAIL